MGGKYSKLLEQEKKAWRKGHTLKCKRFLAKEHKELLQNFSSELFLGTLERNLYGFEYTHYFITDKTWTIEFNGGENCSGALSINSNQHSEALHYNNDKFTLTDDVYRRMGRVCGATNFSLI